MPLFVAIYEAGNLTAAADQLGMTQSNLSHALKKLRQQLDDPLFERKGGGLVASERARQLYQRVPALLQDLNDSMRGEGESETLSLPSPLTILLDSWSQSRLLPVLAEVLGDSLHSGQVRILATDCDAANADWAASLLRGEAQMALATASGQAQMALATANARAQLQSVQLYSDRYVCALRPGHSASHSAGQGGQLTLGDYLLLTHLQVDRASTPVPAKLRQLSKKRMQCVQVADLAAATSLLQASDLALTCPASFATGQGWPILELPFEVAPRTLYIHIQGREKSDSALHSLTATLHRWLSP